MSIGSFFKSFASKLFHIFVIVERLVPEEQLAAGIDLVAEAAKKFVDNADKRAWVIKELMSKFPFISEHAARLIVELGVAKLKEGIDKVDEIAKDHLPK